jgi:hypothetical protein
MDGVEDCKDGIDEKESLWEFCVIGTRKTVIKDKRNCKDAFLCPVGNDAFVDFDLLCDSKESCRGIENEICTISRDIPPKETIARETLKGAKILCNDTSPSGCHIKEFNYPTYSVYGATKSKLSVPSEPVDCSNKFGEHYVYLSCMGLCRNSSCPLKKNILKHDSCSGQYEDRIITLANNSKLTFVTKSEHGYHNDYFQCDNGRCVNLSQVCDLVNDCEDMSDEKDCTNHFKCETEKKHLVGLSQKCDGIYDCLDLSDECNDECSRTIIENSSLLTPFCWIIGILSVLLNVATLAIVPWSLKKCRNENILFSKVLVMLISIGDLLIGIYLVILSAYDSIIHKETFCRKQAEWFTGPECSVLGVISTVGSQLSLFAMTVLSVFRLQKVLLNALPLPVSRLSIIKTISSATLIITISVAIAVIPLIPSRQLDEYFVQGLHYDPEYKVFVGLVSKQKHIKILEQYYQNITANLTSDTPWSEIGGLVDGMFSKNYGPLNRSKVHFYGNDGLCMFKYIIRTDDARRSRQETETSGINLGNEPVVWTILIINLICFLAIFVSAIVISDKTKKSSDQAGQKKNKAARKRNRSLEIRILAIVATDFLCWVPFIIICFLHNRRVLDASKWYQALALIVLPLNSLINPMIYDRTIAQFCKQKVNHLNATLYGTAETNRNVSPQHGDESLNLHSRT